MSAERNQRRTETPVTDVPRLFDPRRRVSAASRSRRRAMRGHMRYYYYFSRDAHDAALPCLRSTRYARAAARRDADALLICAGVIQSAQMICALMRYYFIAAALIARFFMP
jgi:hypothetical protein